jgi:predicted MFS family arabinose efflux permease
MSASPAESPHPPPPVPTASRRSWLAVFSVTVGSFKPVTNEFLPVGPISDIHTGPHICEGTAGTMVTAPGLVAAVSAHLLPVILVRLDRRFALMG